MSRIEELIKEKCPDGVEYITLGEATNMRRGTSMTKAKAVEGNIPVISGGKEPAFYCNIANREEPVITVAGSGAGAGYVQYFDRPIFANDCFTLVGKTGVHTKYVYYFMESIQKRISETKKGAGVPHVHISDVDKFEIPVPPIEVQQEIVRILDKFIELETELQTELDARKKQYEHYRDSLMEFNENEVEWERLDEIFTFIRNGFVGKVTSFFTDAENGIRYLEGTNIHNGIISDNEVLYVTKEFHQKHIKNELKPDDILMVQSGHIGECALVGEKYKGANCHALIIMSNGGEVLSKFYIHYFHSFKGFCSLAPAITGGTIKHVLAGKVGNIKVPVPTIEKQKEIVDILDKFEGYCFDEHVGLPAEIATRHKQYEYYRDKLLTFERKVV